MAAFSSVTVGGMGSVVTAWSDSTLCKSELSTQGRRPLRCQTCLWTKEKVATFDIFNIGYQCKFSKAAFRSSNGSIDGMTQSLEAAILKRPIALVQVYRQLLDSCSKVEGKRWFNQGNWHNRKFSGSLAEGYAEIPLLEFNRRKYLIDCRFIGETSPSVWRGRECV